jgi:hypothetical protein
MRKYIAPLVVASVLCLTFFSSALGAPATLADLSGKKFCWGDGDTMTFSRGGKFSSTRYADGTWRFTSVGVELHATHIIKNLFDIEKLPDGSFTKTDGYADSWAAGNYCK